MRVILGADEETRTPNLLFTNSLIPHPRSSRHVYFPHNYVISWFDASTHVRRSSSPSGSRSGSAGWLESSAKGGILARLLRSRVSVGQQRGAGETRLLDRSRAFDALLNGGGELTGRAIRELLVGDARHVKMNIDAVQR